MVEDLVKTVGYVEPQCELRDFSVGLVYPSQFTVFEVPGKLIVQPYHSTRPKPQLGGGYGSVNNVSRLIYVGDFDFCLCDDFDDGEIISLSLRLTRPHADKLRNGRSKPERRKIVLDKIHFDGKVIARSLCDRIGSLLGDLGKKFEILHF
jgi:hypothetical protein